MCVGPAVSLPRFLSKSAEVLRSLYVIGARCLIGARGLIGAGCFPMCYRAGRFCCHESNAPSVIPTLCVLCTRSRYVSHPLQSDPNSKRFDPARIMDPLPSGQWHANSVNPSV
jgi:hypothetical protein